MTAYGNYIHQLPDGSPWPAGSILGMATYISDENDGGLEQGAKSVQLQVLACDGVNVTAVPVLMQPGDGFYLPPPFRLRPAEPGRRRASRYLP